MHPLKQTRGNNIIQSNYRIPRRNDYFLHSWLRSTRNSLIPLTWWHATDKVLLCQGKNATDMATCHQQGITMSRQNTTDMATCHQQVSLYQGKTSLTWRHAINKCRYIKAKHHWHDDMPSTSVAISRQNITDMTTCHQQVSLYQGKTSLTWRHAINKCRYIKAKHHWHDDMPSTRCCYVKAKICHWHGDIAIDKALLCQGKMHDPTDMAVSSLMGFVCHVGLDYSHLSPRGLSPRGLFLKQTALLGGQQIPVPVFPSLSIRNPARMTTNAFLQNTINLVTWKGIFTYSNKTVSCSGLILSQITIWIQYNEDDLRPCICWVQEVELGVI